ncbi:30S ribosomal protein S5 [Candidatus Micrarchaeota archaeon]|nr:30S ribosomal protein S5 [Candidatus Micrarchaeota archaeon]MBD3418288.1 30S ribosomal protein S5 [Candidatus Micrarchaeota archaeon]
MARRRRRDERVRMLDIDAWAPKTEIGKLVKNKEIATIEEIFNRGKPILEPEVVDALLPELEAETLSVSPTQRTTDSGRKMSFRVIVVLGDKKGHVGIGVGKNDEVKPAIDYAMLDARKNLISVKTGCGSWECKCGTPHSIPREVRGKYGSTEVVLKPAPKGLGLAANSVVKKVLTIAGVKDIWSFSRGSTANVYNMAMATMDALNSLNSMKPQPGDKV